MLTAIVNVCCGHSRQDAVAERPLQSRGRQYDAWLVRGKGQVVPTLPEDRALSLGSPGTAPAIRSRCNG